jgi:hypothetical protein
LSSVPRVIRGALRLPAFALAGMLANYLALRFFSITQETIGPLTFPWTLLFGTGAGAVCWLGFEVGHALWPWLPVSRRSQAALFGLTLLVYFLAGALFGLVNVSIQWSTSVWSRHPVYIAALLAVTLVVIPFESGLLVGARDKPSVFLSFFLGPLLGVLCGFLFGLPLAVMYLNTYQPPPSTAARFTLPASFGALIIVVFITGAGLAIGYLSGMSSGLGLLLCRLTDRQLYREWRQTSRTVPPATPHERAEGTAW